MLIDIHRLNSITHAAVSCLIRLRSASSNHVLHCPQLEQRLDTQWFQVRSLQTHRGGLQTLRHSDSSRRSLVSLPITASTARQQAKKIDGVF